MTVNSNDDPPNSDHVINVVPVQCDVVRALPIGTLKKKKKPLRHPRPPFYWLSFLWTFLYSV